MIKIVNILECANTNIDLAITISLAKRRFCFGRVKVEPRGVEQSSNLAYSTPKSKESHCNDDDQAEDKA